MIKRKTHIVISVNILWVCVMFSRYLSLELLQCVNVNKNANISLKVGKNQLPYTSYKSI